jgi:hypothetical protein
MGQAAAAASGLSVAATGLKAFGDITKAQGTKSVDEFQAAQLERAAQYGELKAVQTNAQLTRNMNITLGHIDAVRAAARTDITSPTGAAVRDYTEEQMTEQKEIQVGNILSQVKQQEADAAYLRYAGNQALLTGEITAGADVLGAVGGALKPDGGPLWGSKPLGQGGIGSA